MAIEVIKIPAQGKEDKVIEKNSRIHDRFLCIDDTVYHIGASLKDLGKKWFAFNRATALASVYEPLPHIAHTPQNHHTF